MNSQAAKRILLLYRPGTADKEDPEVAHALAVLPRDPELSLWFVNHCTVCNAFRDKFRQIPVPRFIGWSNCGRI
jgi:hypothetical protein